MGTLCVIDRVPRTLTESQQNALKALGRQVVALLQLRQAKEVAEQASQAKSELLERLSQEQERSERLLLSLFPKPIADRLKNEAPTCIAEEYAAATILFADIHNFWTIAGALPPVKFIDLLNRVFSMFDRLADEHGVQKIKTIGDSYLAVAGHDHHVRRQFARQFHGLPAIRRFADDGHVLLLFQQPAQSFAEDLVVISQEDSNIQLILISSRNVIRHVRDVHVHQISSDDSVAKERCSRTQ
jgi:class 3 adenylate cyclase